MVSFESCVFCMLQFCCEVALLPLSHQVWILRGPKEALNPDTDFGRARVAFVHPGTCGMEIRQRCTILTITHMTE